jgi:peptidoglycan hydrolase-like protein with peptidoglycan-binding domain
MLSHLSLLISRQPLRSYCWRSVFLGVSAIVVTSAQPLLAQTPNAPVRASLPPANNARPLLKAGSQGETVTELQAMLKLLGYYGGTVNGVYDEATATAVTKFQKSASLTADGVVGADTWNRLLPPSPAVAATAPAPASAKPSTADSFPAPSGTKPTAPPTKPASTTPVTKPATPATGTPQAAVTDPSTLPILRVGMKGPAVEGLQQRLRSLGYLQGSVDGVFGAETQAAVKAAQRKLSLEPDGVVGHATWMGLMR